MFGQNNKKSSLLYNRARNNNQKQQRGTKMFIGGIYIATGVIAQAAKYAANALSKKMDL